jgi:microcompartment protein CcmK/EutM
LDQKDLGGSFLAVDSVQAGVGDQVLVAREGNAARQVLDAGNAPIHSVILAIVDEIDVDPQNT